MSKNMALQSGWDIVLEVVAAPMTLVKFTRGVEVQRARFDVDKRSFIDKIPAEVSKDEREELVENALAASM